MLWAKSSICCRFKTWQALWLLPPHPHQKYSEESARGCQLLELSSRHSAGPVQKILGQLLLKCFYQQPISNMRSPYTISQMGNCLPGAWLPQNLPLGDEWTTLRWKNKSRGCQAVVGCRPCFFPASPRHRGALMVSLKHLWLEPNRECSRYMVCCSDDVCSQGLLYHLDSS